MDKILITQDRHGNYSCELTPVAGTAVGQPYTLGFQKQTGELDNSNSYNVMRFFQDNKREKVGHLNEKYFCPEKKDFTIFSLREIEAITEVMQKIGVTDVKTNS